MRRVLALALPVALLCSATALAHTYAGKSSRAGPMTIRIGPDDSSVIRLSVQRELRCRKGRLRSFREGTFRQSSVFVRSGGGSFFRGSVRTRATRGSQVRLGRFSIRFVRDGSRVHGVFRERVRLRGGTRCTSGRVSFDVPLVDTNDG